MMCEGKKCCGGHWFAWLLVTIGALNWGLVGLGSLLGYGANTWNVVDAIFGAGSVVSGIIYLLVGLAALLKIFGTSCKKCEDMKGSM